MYFPSGICWNDVVGVGGGYCGCCLQSVVQDEVCVCVCGKRKNRIVAGLFSSCE